MVSRYPIPHAGGIYIARVKSLHMRKGLADLNHIDIRKKLEADGDGDEVQIELLTPEVLAAYKEEGAAVKKRVDTHKMAEANKAFSHFRF